MLDNFPQVKKLYNHQSIKILLFTLAVNIFEPEIGDTEIQQGPKNLI